MLCTSDMYTLINYVGFINYLFYGVTVAGQIVLRIKQPDMHRPIKVSPWVENCELLNMQYQICYGDKRPPELFHIKHYSLDHMDLLLAI